MKKKKGFTLIELLVVISIIAMLLAILMPALGKVKKLAQRLVCGTNVKGLGNACYVYANDYDDDFPVQGGAGDNTWTSSTPDWHNEAKDWSGNDELSVASSLYLLVREADVGMGSFVCKGGNQTEHDLDHPDHVGKDLTDLWDFGGEPAEHQSYAYHVPYSNFPPSSTNPSGNAVIADRNPWYDSEELPDSAQEAPATQPDDYMSMVAFLGDDWSDTSSLQTWQRQIANSAAHDREGQNVLFVDGHVSFEKRPDVGSRNDNIYTKANPGVTGRRQGWHSGEINKMLPAKRSDSVLVNDSARK